MDKPTNLDTHSLLPLENKEYLATIYIELYNQELAEAEAEIEAGKFFTQEEVKKMAELWA